MANALFPSGAVAAQSMLAMRAMRLHGDVTAAVDQRLDVLHVALRVVAGC
jgi:hypothetical protein